MTTILGRLVHIIRSLKLVTQVWKILSIHANSSSQKPQLTNKKSANEKFKSNLLQKLNKMRERKREWKPDQGNRANKNVT